ncbi:MAG: hypothetical protein V3T70_04745 [Phycisphaerae bacterium]
MTNRMGMEQYESPRDAVRSLCDGLFDEHGGPPDFTTVEAADVPDGFKTLLVHNNSMTRTLAAYHDRPVDLRVLTVRQSQDVYRRKILLTPRGSDCVVELGVARIELSLLPAAAREDVLAQRIPLGDILAAHGIDGPTEPRWFLRFEPGASPLGDLGGGWSGPSYGRLGAIHKDGHAMIDVLEIVTAERSS